MLIFTVLTNEYCRRFRIYLFEVLHIFYELVKNISLNVIKFHFYGFEEDMLLAISVLYISNFENLKILNVKFQLANLLLLDH